MADRVAVEDRREAGWWWGPNAIVDDPRLNLVTIGVYGLLARHANGERRCWPSTRRLARLGGVGQTTILRALRRLEETGYISVERRQSEHGDHDVSVYVLVGGCSQYGSREPLQEHREPLQEHGGEPLQEQNKTYSSEQDPLNNALERFDVFWKEYPRKTAKEAARRAWQKLRVGPDLFDRIMASLECAGQCEQWRRGVIPHAATWLNGKRWEDEPVRTLRSVAPPQNPVFVPPQKAAAR